MKLSVSVPDDLWEEARSIAAESESSSGVVQEALRRWVAQTHGGPGYSTSPPEDLADALQETSERLAREARAEFKHGYIQGVECAKRLPWWAIEDLADDHHFRIREWADAWSRGAVELDRARPPLPPLSPEEATKAVDAMFRHPRSPFDWTGVDAAIRKEASDDGTERPAPYIVVRALVPALGVLVSPYGDEPGFKPPSTYMRGFTQAMRDIWSSVAEGTNANKG